jgi:endoglucanase
MTDLSDLLGRLSDAFGPSGREAAVRSLIKAEVEPLVDRLEVDAMGNLIAFKAGTGIEPRLKVMLSAHMDEVGFMITEVDKSGLLNFESMRISGVMTNYGQLKWTGRPGAWY